MLNSVFPGSIRLIFSLVVPLLICPAVFSQQGGASGEADHPLLERFAGSTIVAYSNESNVNYQLVLGNMRRTGGRVVAERSERLAGELTRITYEIPQGFNGAEVVEHYQAQAQEKGYTELFSCRGRECGNSNYWANAVFDDRSLYGPDRNQFYQVFQIDTERSASSFAAIYVIARTNRRLFAHVEVLDADNEKDSFVAELSIEEMLDDGAVRIPGLRFDDQDRLLDEGEIDQIARQLQISESIELYVVGHLREQDVLDNLMARSLQRAERVREVLIDRGIDGSRLVARGVGPLAPLCMEGDCAERIELVIRPAD